MTLQVARHRQIRPHCISNTKRAGSICSVFSCSVPSLVFDPCWYSFVLCLSILSLVLHVLFNILSAWLVIYKPLWLPFVGFIRWTASEPFSATLFQRPVANWFPSANDGIQNGDFNCRVGGVTADVVAEMWAPTPCHDRPSLDHHESASLNIAINYHDCPPKIHHQSLGVSHSYSCWLRPARRWSISSHH